MQHESSQASPSDRPPAPAAWPARRRKRPPLDPDALLYDMRECALAMGESVETTRRRLVKSKCTVQIGGVYYTSKGLLRRYLAAISPELIAELDARRADRAKGEQ
jgi:hypothetical protein